MRLSLDDKLETDPRVTLAADRLDMNRDEFVGRVIWVWMAAYRNRSPIMPRRNVDVLARHRGFVEAMLNEDLATPVEDDLVMVRLRGVTERIEFLQIQDAKRVLASAAKRAKAGLPPALPPGPPAGSHMGHAYSSSSSAPSSSSADQPTERDKARAKERVAAGAARALHPEALRLAGVLLDRIASADPGTKIAKLSPEARERGATRWAADVDKLHRLDGIAFPDIESMIDWCQADSFWAGNILSGDALRRNYDGMKRQRARGNGKAQHVGRAEPLTAADYEADIGRPF